ncbi:DNA recombination protein RmuC, partial [Candidatus Woesebacteria bacterium]|nr:DNA recombination protein RmuC [Candidatus Woesebacteria bacterium]
MSSDLIIGAGIGLIIALALYIFSQKRKGSEHLTSGFKEELQEFFRTATNNANEQLITMAQQKLGAEKQEIKTDLDNKRREFEKLIESVQKELRDNDKTSQSIIQQIKDHEKITKDLSITTEGLRKVLTNNQLRGQFGEQVAEDLLKMVGFVKGVDYEYNKAQSSQSRPDFSIFLPDKTRINIDVKFPYANLQKATETDDRAQKEQYLKLFAQDVKQKIAQVTTRDYINPEERTVDFVILFVPNEMIFSYIYDKMNEIWKDGMTKKVILAGPFSFTAILRMVRQAYDNFRYQKNIHHIVA